MVTRSTNSPPMANASKKHRNIAITYRVSSSAPRSSIFRGEKLPVSFNEINTGSFYSVSLLDKQCASAFTL